MITRVPSGFSSNPELEEQINQAVADLHFHNKSELVRAGITKVLDEIKIKEHAKQLKQAGV